MKKRKPTNPNLKSLSNPKTPVSKSHLKPTNHNLKSNLKSKTLKPKSNLQPKSPLNTIPTNKKSQQSIGLSFGLIFSIIIMIFILLTAFIAIKAALGSKDCAQLGLFIQDFENEITNTWNSQENSATFKRTLPTKLEYVCFADLNKNQKGEFPQVYDNMIYYKGNTANTFFYPKSGACKVPYKNIKHLDIDEIIKTQNPYCIPIDRGTIRIKIEKEFNERLVRVS